MKVQTVVRYTSPSVGSSILHLQSNKTFAWENLKGTTSPKYLPKKIDHFLKHSNVDYPSVNDIQYWILAAFAFIMIRRLMERHIFLPLGKRQGLKESKFQLETSCKTPFASTILEKAFSQKKNKLDEKDLLNLSKQTDLTFREIERWFRKRRAAFKPSKLTKVCETGWRLCCYVVSTLIGIGTLWNKPWTWDITQCWTDYPYQTISSEVWWYYLYGAGLYGSCLLTQMFDVRRKDFREMFIHHIVTLGLIGSSWLLNMSRIGTVVLLLHDCSDVFLETAKLAKYTNKNDLALVTFIVFAVVWTATRLVIFPKTILKEGIIQSGMTVVQSKVMYPLFAMLSILFCLHLFWTYFIAKAAVAVLRNDTANKRDTRSSTESSEEESIAAQSDKGNHY